MAVLHLVNTKSNQIKSNKFSLRLIFIDVKHLTVFILSMCPHLCSPFRSSNAKSQKQTHNSTVVLPHNGICRIHEWICDVYLIAIICVSVQNAAEFRLMPCHTILRLSHKKHSAFNESERENAEGRKTSTEQKETIIEKPFHHQSSHKLQFYSSTSIAST